MAKHRAVRTPRDLPVRRWLKLTAASAGMGAAMLGYSLLGAPTGTATADTGTETSSSAESPKETRESATATGATDSDAAATQDAVSSADSSGSDDADESDDTDDTPDASDEIEGDGGAEQDAVSEEDTDFTGGEDEESSEATGSDAPTAVSQGSVDPDDASTTADSAYRRATAATTLEEPNDVPVPAPPWLAPRRSYDEVVADVIARWTSRTQARIEALSVDEETKARLLANFVAMRRAFFNQAPTVAPVQLTGLLTGAITGQVRAQDADGDEIVYRILRGPRSGTVVLNDDGTYTYTPGEGFDGVDTFFVRAVDVGAHVNLLNLFRPVGTRATNLINQNAIRFEFSYTGEDWTQERQQALEEVARSLQEYFRVEKPVTLTYTVGIDPNPKNLASAGSDAISELPGFWPTVVQHKLLTGRDANGDEADGDILWNWADSDWELGTDVSADEYDFVSVAIHELMHSFGFGATLAAPGENRGSHRETYDRFIVTATGVSPLVGGFWIARHDPKLLGEDGGLYWGGRNAVAAYGGLIPLRTTSVWGGGSSISHLEDDVFAGDDQKIMNSGTDAGPAPRVFSDFELGMFRDLGYIVVMPETPPYAAGFVGLVFLLRRRRSDKVAAS
ncbi:hypothetical protein FHR72_000510 [Mycolicibacterium iranicum]|uniref:Uncharacterized protein n=1 Tax=Mycolicibacterium iranicum TaxID=912594 RepID=A0A839Q0V1_MYCIR|nr:Ig-like domain-containing protein [Mycolicibacterium iranicum]MBB2989053.1 hypothetical protein [Mycolicibacterium iranicum]